MIGLSTTFILPDSQVVIQYVKELFVISTAQVDHRQLCRVMQKHRRAIRPPALTHSFCKL